MIFVKSVYVLSVFRVSFTFFLCIFCPDWVYKGILGGFFLCFFFYYKCQYFAIWLIDSD